VRNIKEVVISTTRSFTEEIVWARSKPPWPESTRWPNTRRKDAQPGRRSRPHPPRPRLCLAPHTLADRREKGAGLRASAVNSSTPPWSASACSTRSTRPWTPWRTLERQIRSLEQTRIQPQRRTQKELRRQQKKLQGRSRKNRGRRGLPHRRVEAHPGEMTRATWTPIRPKES